MLETTIEVVIFFGEVVFFVHISAAYSSASLLDVTEFRNTTATVENWSFLFDFISSRSV